jgi:hypothetical protein
LHEIIFEFFRNEKVIEWIIETLMLHWENPYYLLVFFFVLGFLFYTDKLKVIPYLVYMIESAKSAFKAAINHEDTKQHILKLIEENKRREEERIGEIRKREENNDKLKEQIIHLEKTVERQNNLIEKQESTIKHLEETIDRLNKKVDALCEIIIKLTEKKP